MASYTNQVPAGLQEGDVLNLSATGNYVLPRGVYTVTLASGKGGGGGWASVAYRTYESNGWIYEQRYQFGPSYGGYGAAATGSLSLSSAASVQYTHSAAGTDGRTIVLGVNQTGTASSTAGDDAVTAQLTVDGTTWAQCTGGTGGAKCTCSANTILSMEAAGLSRPYSGTVGSNGTAGRVTVAPSGATTSTNNAAGYLKITVVSLNAPPETPTAIDYGTPYANRELELTCTEVSDPDGDAVQYVWETRVDSEAFLSVAATDQPRTVVNVPGRGTTFQAQVKAVDSNSAASSYITGASKLIIYNYPPEISGEDEDRGEIEQPFLYSFTVDDPDDADTLGFSVKLDGMEIYALDDLERNQTYTADLEESWPYLAAGKHTLTIYAYDDNGGTDKRTISFTRYCSALELETLNPIETDSLVSTVMTFFNFKAPDDATVLLQLRNDPAAAWEDVTAYNYSREIFTFANTDKTVSPAQLDARVYIQKGASGGDIYFYGATLLLDANGEETIAWAQGVRINPANIAEDGILTAADSDVMKALNTLSFSSGAGGDANGLTAPVVKSSLTGTVLDMSENENWAWTGELVIPDPEVWTGYVCSVVGEAENVDGALAVLTNPVPSEDMNPNYKTVAKYVYMPEEPQADASGNKAIQAVSLGLVPCALATDENIGSKVYANTEYITYDYDYNEATITSTYGTMQLEETELCVGKVVAAGWIWFDPENGREYGSNTNGEYWKFSDGLMICTRKEFTFAAANTGYIWYYPALFADAPAVTIGQIGAAAINTYIYASQRFTNYAHLRSSAINTYGVDLMAVGRWK